MAKFYGKIGYAVTVETAPGVWIETITEKEYYGDVTRNMRRLEGSQEVNEDVNISNTISIVSDPFATNNIYAMRYVEYMGAKWKVNSVDVQYPRLVLTLGGLYNETENGITTDTRDDSGE